MNVSLCGNLCGSFKIPVDVSGAKIKRNKTVNRMFNDINLLLTDSDFDKKFICNHILNKIIQLTNSEYGFIGKVVDDVLYTYAISNIAWNAASHDFFVKNIESNLRFSDMNTIFGESIMTGTIKVVNKYDTERNVLPSGHPPIKRFLGVPMVIGGKTIAFVGVCNKINKFTKKDGKNVSSLLSILSYLFITLE